MFIVETLVIFVTTYILVPKLISNGIPPLKNIKINIKSDKLTVIND